MPDLSSDGHPGHVILALLVEGGRGGSSEGEDRAKREGGGDQTLPLYDSATVRA